VTAWEKASYDTCPFEVFLCLGLMSFQLTF